MKTLKELTKNKILKQQGEQDVFNSRSCATVILPVSLNPIWHGLFLNRQSLGGRGGIRAPHHNFVLLFLR